MKNKELQDALSEPFPRKDIEFRVSRISRKTCKASVLAYITARGIMRRLDDVFGITGWKDEYVVMETGVKCRLSVKMDSDWITKEDVAPFTTIEALKGAFSDSLKRAGVKFGIGRYLYDLREYWVDIIADRPVEKSYFVHYHSSRDLSGYWVEPILPEWALPSISNLIPIDFKEKLNSFIDNQLMTKDIYEQYIKTLSNPNVTKEQKELAWEQLNLITYWAKNIYYINAISTTQKRSLYKRILSSDLETLDEVKTVIRSYSEKDLDLEVA